MGSLVPRPSQVVQPEVVDGEVGTMTGHRLCGGQHWTVYAQMRCCCGDIHDLGAWACCGCGHHHDPDGDCKPDGPCGSYLCCIN